MPQVYFNVGRANRSGTQEFTTVNAITPDPLEAVMIELSLPTNQLTDPTRQARMEVYRSADNVTWQFLAAANFVGHPENVAAPAVGVNGSMLNGFFLRARIIITGSMNVGFTVHSRSQQGV